MLATSATITSCSPKDTDEPNFTLKNTTERFTDYLNFTYTICVGEGEQSTIDNYYFIYNNGINVRFVYLTPTSEPFREGDQIEVHFQIDYPANMLDVGIFGLIQISGHRPDGNKFTKRFSVRLLPHDNFTVDTVEKVSNSRVEVTFTRTLEQGQEEDKLEIGRCTVVDFWGPVAFIQSVLPISPLKWKVTLDAPQGYPLPETLDKKDGRFCMLYAWQNEKKTQNVGLTGIHWEPAKN